MTNCFVVPIDQSGVGLDASTNNIVEYNSFSNINDACFDYFFEANSEVRFNYAFHTKGAASPSGTGLSLHHNVFNLDVAGGGINASHAFNFTDSQIARDTGPVLVYNNVIYNCTGYGLYAGAASSTNVIFRNNIVVATSNVTGLAKLATGVNSDYNLYYMLGMNNQGAPLWSWNSGGWLRSLGDFRAASGQDAHSLYADPRFVSTRPVVAADFQLRGISPGINVGQNLRNTGLLMPAQQYQDYLGALVPEGAGPDIGAYERKLDRPAAPTNPLFKP